MTQIAAIKEASLMHFLIINETILCISCPSHPSFISHSISNQQDYQ